MNERVMEIECDDGDPLLCPNCKFNYLHHDQVTVYYRLLEDEPSRATVVRQGVSYPSVRRDNPSERRNGVAISFWCESCHVISELTIRQQKGQTYFSWRPWK